MKKTFLRLLGSTMTASLLVGTMGQFPAYAAVENGWEEVDGKRYWYENGVKQGTEGRGKEIYDPGSDAWYWLDAVDDGKMAVSKDVYQESLADDAGNIGKWVRYDSEGHMVKGWDDTEVGIYYFDLTYGTMAKGSREIDGVPYFFNEETGILESGGTRDGWVTIGGKEYWYEGGVRQGYNPNDPAYRGKEIYDPGSDAWYWLDNIQQGAKAVSKDVYQESQAGPWAENSDGTGKWVRYDSEGHMVKGWETTENGKYYFDPVYGTMAKGKVVIEGTEYNFDQTTGIMAEEAVPTDVPTQAPTAEPSNEPTAAPTAEPSSEPTAAPTAEPSSEPTAAPTAEPSSEPTAEPTTAPTDAPDGTMKWDITDGKLTVTGRIVGEDICGEKAPWYGRREEITSVVMKGAGEGSFESLFSGYKEENSYNYNRYYPNVKEIDLSALDTSAVTNMRSMFAQCTAQKIDLSNLNTSAVTDMGHMFEHCYFLSDIDTSSFDTSNVTDMSHMFSALFSVLAELDLSNFDTSNVMDMSCMFAGCNGMSNINVSSFDTSAVTNMAEMFSGCSRIENIDVSNFDTSSVTNMRGMFSECEGLTEIALPSFDTSAVTDMWGTFYGCTNLKDIDLSNFDTSSVTTMGWMFGDCTSLEKLDLTSFDTSSVETMFRMFSGCKNLKEILVNGNKWNTENVDTEYMFAADLFTEEELNVTITKK